jgi:hypothetical protein
MQHAVFISYRREDVPDAVGRVYDRLTAAFGEAAIFKDVDALPVGEDFEKVIASVIARCSVALVMIGPAWAETFAKRQDSLDLVRIEIETALKTPNVEVIPVLLAGADLPTAEHLPGSLHPLLRLHAATVRRDPDFHRDMSKLVTNLSARGVERSDEGSGAVGLWRELSQTEDIEDLRRFIDTFGGTAQAFEARRRVDQLSTVRRLRHIGAYVEHTQPEEEEAGWLLIDGIDAFKRCWAKTPWDNELARLRELAMENVDPGSLAYYEHGPQAADDIPAETLEDWGSRANKFIAAFSGGPS